MNGFFNLIMIEHQPVSFSGLINKKCLFQKQTSDRGFTYLVWTEAMCIQIKPVRDFWQVLINELVGFSPTNTTTYKCNAKLIEGTSDAISQQGRQTTVPTLKQNRDIQCRMLSTSYVSARESPNAGACATRAKRNVQVSCYFQLSRN